MMNEAQLDYINKIGELKNKGPFTNIINVNKSIRTNSFYILANDEGGQVYQIAFSDHKSEVHHDEFFDFDLDEADETDEISDLFTEASMLIDEEFSHFGIKESGKYDESVVAELTTGEAYSRDRAYSYENAEAGKIINAELINDNQVLRVTYNDADEYYIDYTPYGNKEDAVIAQVAKSNDIEPWKLDIMYTLDDEEVMNNAVYQYETDAEVEDDATTIEEVLEFDEDFIEKLDGYNVFLNKTRE